MKVKVNEGCISCGACVTLCPEVFQFNDEGTAEAVGNVSEENLERAKSARDGCPVDVIDIEE